VYFIVHTKFHVYVLAMNEFQFNIDSSN